LEDLAVISQRQHRAASHFGLGVSRRDIAAMGDDPKGWLVDQLDAKRATTLDVPSTRETLFAYQEAFAERRRMQASAEGNESKARDAQVMQRQFRQRARQTVGEQVGRRFNFAVTTAAPFRERLVHFYSNHFTVSQQGRPQLIGSCVGYENEAIRRSLDGHFADMLVAVVAHPVMSIYLDNAQSVGPNSRAGRRRDVGLNENLAREVLELHTLGVDGGYDQDDVRGLAKMLTGWTVGNARLARFGHEAGAPAFVPFMHEPGTHKLLGKSYREAGAGQATSALRDLALHPSTGMHLATKLARHFIADDPPAAAIEKLGGVYRDTQGHLPSVHRALLELDASWGDSRKFKSPHEYVVSIFRGLDAGDGALRQRGAMMALRTMNHVPFTAPSPAGWPDVESHWASPSALKQRVQWGVAVGQRIGSGIDARDALHRVVAPTDAVSLESSVARAESGAQALSLLVASPAMQWR
jgi:uncharacterized protein (DUF1800 family)